MSKLSPAVTALLVAISLILSACQAATPAATSAPLPTVIIPTPFPAATSAPQHPEARADATRLDFSSTTMLSSPGDIKSGSAIQAVFTGEAGRKIYIKSTFDSGGTGALSLWGADGTTLIPEVSGITEWEGVLPSAQDYFLNLRNPGKKTLGYQLIVRLPPLALPAATRIQFQPNTTGGTTKGDLAPGARLRYVLGAAAGQTMTVNLSTASAEVDAYLYVWSADGTVYTLAAPVKEWSGRLPATQDYYIELVSASGQPVAYQLGINIPPSIPTLPPAPTAKPKVKIARDEALHFTEDAPSVEVNGAVISGQRDRFTFEAKKGDTLSVEITSEENNAVFTILGPDEKALPGTEEGADIARWSEKLPEDGLYTILVGPTRANATYALKVKF